jgi:hypothetical protein
MENTHNKTDQKIDQATLKIDKLHLAFRENLAVQDIRFLYNEDEGPHAGERVYYNMDKKEQIFLNDEYIDTIIY